MIFRNHFYYGTEINCIDVSGKTVGEAEKKISSELQKYSLKLVELNGKSEEINATDVGLKYRATGEIKKLKDKQNPIKWISAFFTTESFKDENEFYYDKDLLKKRMDKLSCLDNTIAIKPQNPSFKYTENGYTIINETKGSMVDKDKLYSEIIKAIDSKEKQIDLEAKNCYAKPEYTSNSPKILDTKNTLNKYISSKITYTFGNHSEILDGSVINTWLTVDNKFQIKIDDKNIKEYLNKLSTSYNTVGSTRSFLTSTGKTIKVSGGDYGWKIDNAKEEVALMADIKAGEQKSKEPLYIQKSGSRDNNDIGNTYVEIDMTRQHLWFYKNGQLVVQGDVVTGNMSSNHLTPAGVYSIKYKQRNATLVGQGYSAPVSYWMPFNGGIGIHDASWRSSFGGSIYKTDGSHGCINSPYAVASTIFSKIQSGDPVVCYY